MVYVYAKGKFPQGEVYTDLADWIYVFWNICVYNINTYVTAISEK